MHILRTCMHMYIYMYIYVCVICDLFFELLSSSLSAGVAPPLMLEISTPGLLHHIFAEKILM